MYCSEEKVECVEEEVKCSEEITYCDQWDDDNNCIHESESCPLEN